MQDISNNPLVSICIPTFNGERFLRDSLSSVENQTYRNFEVILSDDFSKDQTLNIISDFQKNASFPVHIYNHEPSGIGANWNNCLKNSNGEYVKFLFQDDILFPSCIADMLETIKKDPDLGMVASKREILKPEKMDSFHLKWINSYSDLQKDWDYGREGILFLDREFLKHSDFLRKKQNRIGEPTATLFKKSILKKVGYFREDLIQDLDFEFYIRTLKYYKIALLTEKLVGFRLHTGQATYLNQESHHKDKRILDWIYLKDFFWFLDKSHKRNLLINYFPRFRRVIKFLW